jgi:Mycothiol maleylpyruvate isomerase N-terminal domain
MAPVESEVVAVTHLFPPERASLVELLGSLDAGQWRAPTVCPGWSVKDVALHLLGDDVGLLSRRRDGVLPAGITAEPAGWEELVASLDRLNQTWVAATRLVSPRLLCELLTFTGEATWRYLGGLDPFAAETRVSWVGPDPAPNWLDVAREYSERWTHQQQIRDAVVIAGEQGGRWVLTRTPERWRLAAGTAPAPAAQVTLDADTAWRRWTKGIGRDAARAAASISGERSLGLPVLDAVAIIG